MTASAVFAIPGDKDQRTGGTIYDAKVLERLNEIGHVTEFLRLPDSFPDPSSSDMQTCFDLLNAVPKTRPIIVDGLALGAMAPDLVKAVKAPVIAMLHHPLGLETGLTAHRAEALLRNESEVLRHVRHVIVPSAHVARTVEDRLGVAGARISVATPGFAPPKRAMKRAPGRPMTILSVGLLAKRKGHDVLIDALARLTDLEWRAEIVGKAHDPQVADALQAQVAKFGLSDRVRFRGEIGPTELADAYARADVFALATRYEGYGMVLSEAMTHLLPVVSCNVGAVPETVGEAGLLVEPDDADAFAAALRSLIAEPKTYETYALAAKTRAAALPSWTQTAEVFVDALRRVTPCA